MKAKPISQLGWVKRNIRPTELPRALQRTAAPLGSRTVRENLLATVATDRAFPAAVAELDR